LKYTKRAVLQEFRKLQQAAENSLTSLTRKRSVVRIHYRPLA
jgi:hypothetical protein